MPFIVSHTNTCYQRTMKEPDLASIQSGGITAYGPRKPILWRRGIRLMHMVMALVYTYPSMRQGLGTEELDGLDISLRWAS